MKRRDFVLLTGLGISAVALPTWYYKFHEVEYNGIISEPELLSYIWDNDTISEIGKSYLAQFPDENSERKLVNLLSDYISTETTTTEVLHQQITDDFKEGTTVMIDGWVLSRTEGRQCALFSLNQTH